MTTNESRRAIEAILMVAEDPVPPNLLAQLTELSVARVEELCDELAAIYEVEERGFVLARVAGGYRYQSHPDLAPYIERFVLDGKTTRMSAAALETLAIVAYKQPISRAQVASIRGVNVDAVVRTLQQRGYIDEVARDPGPGQAVLYGTTTQFLEKLGLDSLDQLPPLGEFVPDADVVEQLERGLRGDRADAAEAAEAAAAAERAEAAEGVGEASEVTAGAVEAVAGEAVAGDAVVAGEAVAVEVADGEELEVLEDDPGDQVASLDADVVWTHADVMSATETTTEGSSEGPQPSGQPS